MIKDVSTVVFVIIFLIVLFGVAFNISRRQLFAEELSRAMHDIALGHFSQKIYKFLDSEVYNLIAIFNMMSRKLLLYEKQNIACLAIEKARLEKIISITSEGILLLDRDLRIISVNQIALRALKISKYSVVGTDLLAHLPAHVSSQISPVLNEILKKNHTSIAYSVTKHLYISQDTPKIKNLRLVVTTVIDHHTNVSAGVAMTVQDIIQEIQLNKAKSQFVSNVSHELRTPLFNIRSFLDTLVEYNHSLSDIQKIEFLHIASQETQRLSCLVNNVLDLSRLESDFEFSLTLVDLRELIPSVIKAFMLRSKNQLICLSFQVSPDIPVVYADFALITQVLANLVSNSLKFTGPGGCIIIRAYPVISSSFNSSARFSRVRVEVIDEGAGIDLRYNTIVFDKFVRLENNIHTLNGTGLGLSIVKNIIEKHQSRINFYSELGVGSVFWFDLVTFEKKI